YRTVGLRQDGVFAHAEPDERSYPRVRDGGAGAPGRGRRVLAARGSGPRPAPGRVGVTAAQTVSDVHFGQRNVGAAGPRPFPQTAAGAGGRKFGESGPVG